MNKILSLLGVSLWIYFFDQRLMSHISNYFPEDDNDSFIFRQTLTEDPPCADTLLDSFS